MAKYILSKKAKGKKYQYTVTDEKGNVVSTRTSARDYVACTANGEFYFGRLDLIGKGDHGKEYNADTRNLRRGWGRCCCKSCAAQLRENKKPGYNSKRVAINNVRRQCWTDCPETERYPFSYDGADFDQWGDCEFGIHD